MIKIVTGMPPTVQNLSKSLTHKYLNEQSSNKLKQPVIVFVSLDRS